MEDYDENKIIKNDDNVNVNVNENKNEDNENLDIKNDNNNILNENNNNENDIISNNNEENKNILNNIIENYIEKKEENNENNNNNNENNNNNSNLNNKNEINNESNLSKNNDKINNNDINNIEINNNQIINNEINTNEINNNNNKINDNNNNNETNSKIINEINDNNNKIEENNNNKIEENNNNKIVDNNNNNKIEDNNNKKNVNDNNKLDNNNNIKINDNDNNNKINDDNNIIINANKNKITDNNNNNNTNLSTNTNNNTETNTLSIPLEPPTPSNNPENNAIKFPHVSSLLTRTQEYKKMSIKDFYLQSRHYFIMTDGGAPIYSRYSDELEINGILATFSAIITKFVVFHNEKNTTEKLNYISNDKTLIVFLKKNKLYFIALSNNKNESISFLYSQLEYIYNLLLSILTSQRIPFLEEKPNSCYNILTETYTLFENLIEKTSENFSSLLKSYKISLINERNKINEILNNNRKEAILSIIFNKDLNEIISISKSYLINICAMDIFLIQNLLTSSFYENENWSQICLPEISSEGFLQIYSNFSNKNFVVVFVTENSEIEYFNKFSEYAKKIIKEIEEKNLVENIEKIYYENDENNFDEINEKNIEIFVNKIFRENDFKLENNNNKNLRISLEENKNEKKTISNLLFKNIKNDPFLKIKFCVVKNKLLNQFFSINLNNNNKIVNEIIKIYNNLYDILNSQENNLININNFFHFQKNSYYLNVIYTNENYVCMSTFNLFISYDEAQNILKDFFKLIKNNENKFFVNIK